MPEPMKDGLADTAAVPVSAGVLAKILKELAETRAAVRRLARAAERKSQDATTFNLTAAGKILGFSRWEIAGMIERGELGCIPRGRVHKRVPIEAIEKWRRENTAWTRDQLRRMIDGRTKLMKGKKSKEAA